MAGLVRPNWALPPSQRQPTAPAPTSTTPAAPGGNTPNYNAGQPGGTGAAPGGTQYPATPGTFNNNPGGQTPTGTKYDVDPTGMMTPYTPFASGPGEVGWRPGTPTDLYALQQQRLMALLTGLKDFGLVGGPQNPLARETPGPAPARETPSTMADRVPAETAAFGRAKERIGKIGGSALMALKDRSTAGGRSNSGLEAKDRRAIVANTASELGDVVRDQAIDQIDRADQIDDRNLATGVAQREQDLSTRAGDLASQVQQRGQDYNALLNPYQNPLMSMVPSLFGMFGARTY